MIKLDHVAVIVTDMEKSIEFYKDTFNLNIQFRGETKTRRMTFLEGQHTDVTIELIQDIQGNHEYSNNSRINHIAFSVTDIEKSVKKLKEKGIQFQTDDPVNTIGNRKMIFFTGPDNELIQLIENKNEQE